MKLMETIQQIWENFCCCVFFFEIHNQIKVISINYSNKRNFFLLYLYRKIDEKDAFSRYFNTKNNIFKVFEIILY